LNDYHAHGSNPRTHPFHSWLFQKIDPKKSAARRKKFFGTGRKKREVFTEISQGEELNQSGEKIMRVRRTSVITNPYEGEKISINLGVKRITIDEPSFLDTPTPLHLTSEETSSPWSSLWFNTAVGSTLMISLLLLLLIIVGSVLQSTRRHHIKREQIVLQWAH